MGRVVASGALGFLAVAAVLMPGCQPPEPGSQRVAASGAAWTGSGGSGQSRAGSTSPEPAPAPPQSQNRPERTGSDVVVSIVDGDTIDTSEGRVRIVGIDAPEMDTQRGPSAKQHLDELVGSIVELRADASTHNRDGYDRLPRDVLTVDGTDAGYQMIKDNLAVARYDSRDGDEYHRNEDVYHEASRSVTCPATAPTSGARAESRSEAGTCACTRTRASARPRQVHRLQGVCAQRDIARRPRRRYTKIDCTTKLPIR